MNLRQEQTCVFLRAWLTCARNNNRVLQKQSCNRVLVAVREDRGSNLRGGNIFRVPVKLSLNTSRSHSDSENGWMDVRECTRAQLDEETTKRE